MCHKDDDDKEVGWQEVWNRQWKMFDFKAGDTASVEWREVDGVFQTNKLGEMSCRGKCATVKCVVEGSVIL